MNYNSFTYPLHQSDEILLQATSIPLEQQTLYHQRKPQVLFSHHDQYPNNGECISFNQEKLQAHNQLPHSHDHHPPRDDRDHDQTSNDIKKKRKVIHREVERQRRQEMANLYKNLRSLLPSEYLKGKRSISDHMKEVVNYIKHKENKIKELRNRRDELIRLSSSVGKSDLVKVQPSRAGLEVVITTGLREGMLPLSVVLELLGEEGLGVVSCVSTRINETTIHTIQSEVCTSASVEPAKLQVKLMGLVMPANGIDQLERCSS